MKNHRSASCDIAGPAHPARGFTGFLALLCLIGLGACQSPFNGPVDAWSAQGNHPITVATKLVSQQFDITANTSALRQDDRDRMTAIATDYIARGIGNLSISAPQGSPNATAAVEAAAEMQAIAQSQGVGARQVDISGYHAAANAATPVIVSYTVYEATASACGNWSKNYAFAPLNLTTPDHGCATQNNLAAMVENPRDLITPRPEEASDQGRREVTLDKYRQGEVTSAAKDDQASGTVSEVNQQ